MYEPLYCFPSGPACQLLFRLLGEEEVLTLNLDSKIGNCSRRNKTEVKIGSLTPQAFKGYGQVVELPQDPDKALVATYPQDAPRPEDIKAFYLKEDEMIILDKGVWHYAPFTTKEHKEASALLFLKRRLL